jgi:endonuclease/exonuclease/phosphatase family metal-dependent hydrolase
MPTPLRIATFNVENLDDKPGQSPTLAQRIAVMRPQLERLRADVLCLQEVNGQEQPGRQRQLLALQQLIATTELAGFNVQHTRTQAGEAFDERNLVILSRFPFDGDPREIKHEIVEAPLYRTVTEIPAATEAQARTWERPIFYVKITLPGGRILHVINLHLKSKLPTTIKGQKAGNTPWKTVQGWAEGFFVSSMKRVGQALETRAFLDTIFDADPDALIAVCGDMNGEMDDVPVQAIRGGVEDTENPEHIPYAMIPCGLSVAEPARYSLLHRGKGILFDHVLVSRRMLAHYRGTEIHNELVHDESIAFAVDTKFPESDHAPVVAEFELP